MHNGVLETLEAVLAFYDEGDSENPHVVERRGRRGGGDGQERAEGPIGRLDRDFQRVDDMSEDEMTDIIAFLESLSDPDFDTTIPGRVPSGLPPGGAIR